MEGREIKQVVYWKQAFDETIEHYHTVKSCNGQVKGLDYSKVSGGNSAQTIRATPSDFICDVELAGRRALDERLHKIFVDHYVTCVREPNTQDVDIDTVRTQVGRVLAQRRVYPVSSYFRPKTINRGKKAA